MFSVIFERFRLISLVGFDDISSCRDTASLSVMVFSYYFLLKDTAENLCVAIVGHKLNLFKNVTQCYLLSANPGLNFNLGFFFFFSKAFSRIIHQIVSKKE